MKVTLGQYSKSMSPPVSISRPENRCYSEWNQSWKRYLLEVMFRMGWTLLYRSHPEQIGFATSILLSPGRLASEEQRRCLVSLPLDESESFAADTIQPDQIRSSDYCAAQVSIDALTAQGVASTQSLLRPIDHNEEFTKTLQLFAKATGLKGNRMENSAAQSLSSGYNITFLEQAKVIMIVSFSPNVSPTDIQLSTQHFSTFPDGSVHFLVLAPMSSCQSLVRGVIYATCVDTETLYANTSDPS